MNRTEIVERLDRLARDAKEVQRLLCEAAENTRERQRRLDKIVELIDIVENRCMAADGPVTPTLQEMTEEELRRIYALAKGVSSIALPTAERRKK